MNKPENLTESINETNEFHGFRHQWNRSTRNSSHTCAFSFVSFCFLDKSAIDHRKAVISLLANETLIKRNHTFHFHKFSSTLFIASNAFVSEFPWFLMLFLRLFVLVISSPVFYLFQFTEIGWNFFMFKGNLPPRITLIIVFGLAFMGLGTFVWPLFKCNFCGL